ncbi:MAG: ABC transporter permease [Candidatus Bipolaricaulota bacterium]|nr:ABC transporter permease [Candidatus Bipolaricaulota bacterium]
MPVWSSSRPLWLWATDDAHTARALHLDLETIAPDLDPLLFEPDSPRLPAHLAALGSGPAVIVASADFLSPYRPETQATQDAYAPPTRLHFSGPSGFSLRPYVVRATVSFDPVTYERTSTENPLERYAVRFFGRGDPYRLWGIFPTNVHLFTLGDDAARAGVRIYLWGADRLGRDVFTRTLFGGRVSLSVGPSLGGWVDAFLQRVGELVGSLPSLPVLLILGAALSGVAAPPAVRILAVLGGLAAISWPGMARVIRGQILSLRGREFVLAARASGASEGRIFACDLLPHVATTIVVGGALLLPSAMVLEASLSFLGLGIPEPTPSWGTLLVGARSVSALATAPWLLVPGALIALSAFAANLIADALRESLAEGDLQHPQLPRGRESRARSAERVGGRRSSAGRGSNGPPEEHDLNRETTGSSCLW